MPGWDAVRQAGDMGYTVLDCPAFVLEERWRAHYERFLAEREDIREKKAAPPQPVQRVHRPTAAELEEMERLYRAGCSDAKIAERTGISLAAVRRWRTRHHLPSNGRGNAPESVCLQRLTLYNQGYTDREIAAAEGASSNTISAWRRRLGLPYNRRKKGGETK